MIHKQETFIPEEQAVRVVLTNELGHVVHDLKLSLVVTVDGEHRAFDVDRVVNEHVAMHEKRHCVFIKAAQARGHVGKEHGCGCG